MTNIVLQLTEVDITRVVQRYQSDQVHRQAPGVIFAAKLPDTAITVYKSGKVMFQGVGASREAAHFQAENVVIKKSSITKGDTLPEQFATLSVLGSDETGTGDYFGPMTVTAVYIPADQIELVQELGVKDSKQLTDDYMRQIAPSLKKACVHSTLILRNEKYNQLQAKGYSQGKMKAMMHNQALKHVLHKIAPEKPDYILIDQFAERGIYYNHLKNEKEIIQENVLFSTKAENLHVAVATASILARYAFLKEMDQLSQQIGLPIPKGASAKVDQIAAQILTKFGEETLKAMTKWHFANTEKAKRKCKK